MKNKIVIFIGLIITMPIYAESKAYYAKKTAKVGLYLTEIATGAVLGIWPLQLVKECKESIKDGKCTLIDISFPSIITLESALLLINGVAGLNKEIELKDKIKRLCKFVLAERIDEKK